VVRGTIVDEKMLIAIAAEPGHHVPDAAIDFLDVGFLVVTGGEDTDALHRDAGFAAPFLTVR
jgi:hypothetical protein